MPGKGGDHRQGPNFYGLFGRRAGTARGFNQFSETLKASGVVWDEYALDWYLKYPHTLTSHPTLVREAQLGKFGDLRNKGMRRDLIAFLKRATEG